MISDENPREEIPFSKAYPDLSKTSKLELFFVHDPEDDYLEKHKAKPVISNLKQASFRPVSQNLPVARKALNEPEYLQQTSSKDLDIRGNEYDLDRSDYLYLRAYNKRHGLSVSEELWEVVLTLIEVAMFVLQRRMPPAIKSLERQALNLLDGISEDACCICGEADCDNSNSIVFCDGCDIGVHQECYGVPFIPEGQWLCRQCRLSRKCSNACVLCPNKAGAMKMTDSGPASWAHVICALWIPETYFSNNILMEPICGIDAIPRSRWNLKCYLCKIRIGACIQCVEPSCFQAFHVTCARRAGLMMKLAGGFQAALADAANLVCYCDKHNPPNHALEPIFSESKEHFARMYLDHVKSQNHLNGDFGLANGAHGSTWNTSNERHQVANSVAKTPWKTSQGIALVPKTVIDQIANRLAPVGVKRGLVKDAAKYWVLKRHVKGGAQLVRKLADMPITHSDADEGKKREHLQKLISSQENKLFETQERLMAIKKKAFGSRQDSLMGIVKQLDGLAVDHANYLIMRKKVVNYGYRSTKQFQDDYFLLLFLVERERAAPEELEAVTRQVKELS